MINFFEMLKQKRVKFHILVLCLPSFILREAHIIWIESVMEGRYIERETKD
jgi:hypothetical protein